MRRVIPSSCKEAMVLYMRDRTIGFIDPHKIIDWKNVLFDNGGSIVTNDMLMISSLEVSCQPYLPLNENEERIRVLALSGKLFFDFFFNYFLRIRVFLLCSGKEGGRGSLVWNYKNKLHTKFSS